MGHTVTRDGHRETRQTVTERGRWVMLSEVTCRSAGRAKKLNMGASEGGRATASAARGRGRIMADPSQSETSSHHAMRDT